MKHPNEDLRRRTRVLRQLLLTMVLFGAMETHAFSQSLTSGDGFMELYVSARSFTLLPVARGDTTIVPPVYGYEYGEPMTFTFSGVPGQEFRVSFAATDIIFCSGRTDVWFEPDAMYWRERGTLLDPTLSHIVSCDSSGVATIRLGLTIAIPELTSGWSYAPTVQCTAVDIGTGDSLAAVAIVEVRSMGFSFPAISELRHLSRGYTYTLTPEGGAGIVSPRINGEERGVVQSITLSVEHLDTIWLFWVLPSVLSSDEDTGSIPCSFAPDAIRVRETGERLDPHVANMLVSGGRCELTLDVGFTVSVPAGAFGGYNSGLLVSVVYNGNMKRLPARLPAEGYTQLWASVAEDEIPLRYELLQNYPNPFNSGTTIRYALPRPGEVSLTIRDILGRLVATIVNEYQYAGWHSARWAADNVPSGVYFYEIRTPASRLVRSLLLLK